MSRVLFVLNTTGFGGLEVVLLDWLVRVDYSSTSVTIASSNHPLVDRVQRLGLPVNHVKFPVEHRRSVWHNVLKWNSFFRSQRADRIVLLEGSVGEFDLTPVIAASLHSRDLFIFESLAPRRPVKAPSRKHFGFLPGLGLHYYRSILGIRLRRRFARRILVASRGVSEKLKTYFGYPAVGTEVLYHGVDVRRFQPSSAGRASFRRRYAIPDDAIVIVSHGRLHRVKRIDRILNAFRSLASTDPNLWLVLTSYGPLKAQVEQEVASLECKDRIRLIDFQSDLSQVLQAADIYVLASENEGFGIALVEAMSVGLLCVATDTSGPSEILANGENGLLVAESDAGVLQGLNEILRSSPFEQELMRLKARETVLSKFNLDFAVAGALNSLQIPSSPLVTLAAGAD